MSEVSCIRTASGGIRFKGPQKGKYPLEIKKRTCLEVDE